MRKNFIIVLMTMAIVFSVGVICHAETFEPTIDAMNGKVGETIDVTVSIPGGTTAVGGSFNLVYDNTKMELIDATAGELVKDRTNNVNKAYAANKIRMNFAGTTNISENGGVALKATFKLLAEGTANISTEKFKLMDIDTNSLSCNNASKDILIKNEVAAPDPIKSTINAINGKVGETIDVTVSIPGGTTAVGGSFNLVYDNTKMELIDATAGEVVKDRTNNVNKAYAANKIRMNFAGTTNISENGGVALKASFKLLAEGTANISTENFKLMDIDTNALVCEDGSITISIAAAEPTVIPVTGISLSKTNLQLEVGKSEKITAIFSPDNATNRNVLWLSTASNIATVENGNITAVSEGNAQIIAITEDGSKSAVCTVTVIKSSKKEPAISVGGISFDITLDADEYSGNIIAALYSKEGKLNNLKTYPATRDLKISFDKGKTGAYIKIMWWKNLSSMIPVCEAQTITLQ